MTPETALAWLNDLMRWLARWVPRLTLVHPTHKGVLFGPGGGARATGPGLVVYWPMTHELVLVPVTTQSVEFCARVLPLDGPESERLLPRVVVCTCAVQFRVTDAVAASTRTLHLLALVDNRAQSTLGRYWKGQLQDRGFVGLAREELASTLLPYGVSLEALDVVSIGIGVVLKNLHDWSYSDNVGGTRAT